MRPTSPRVRPGPRRRAAQAAISSWLLAGAVACATTQPYLDPTGPRHAGVPTATASAPSSVDGLPERGTGPLTLQVASFNIQEGREIDGALDVILGNPGLAEADFILLQEMDPRGTERIAAALGMAWVYYPAGLRDGRGWGNAVLSRWPLEEDEKIVLPHQAWLGGTRRIATAVTARVGDVRVRVYSVHLATPLNQSRGDREDQLRTVLEDAAPYAHVIIGGDLNSGSLAEVALGEGYQWPTREGPRTVWFSRVDHVLYKGLVPTWFGGAGTVTDNGGASDHLPVWARGRIR
ncbi:MAG TPA: endonuclease/exonuclease/phosphatase family protein [Longimicrobiales bacterium]|nr:endonuclease/exonuclease/phosphatase family protein [Longimicrobiales bacterium]